MQIVAAKPQQPSARHWHDHCLIIDHSPRHTSISSWIIRQGHDLVRADVPRTSSSCDQRPISSAMKTLGNAWMQNSTGYRETYFSVKHRVIWFRTQNVACIHTREYQKSWRQNNLKSNICMSTEPTSSDNSHRTQSQKRMLRNKTSHGTSETNTSSQLEQEHVQKERWLCMNTRCKTWTNLSNHYPQTHTWYLHEISH